MEFGCQSDFRQQACLIISPFFKGPLLRLIRKYRIRNLSFQQLLKTNQKGKILHPDRETQLKTLNIIIKLKLYRTQKLQTWLSSKKIFHPLNSESTGTCLHSIDEQDEQFCVLNKFYVNIFSYFKHQCIINTIFQSSRLYYKSIIIDPCASTKMLGYESYISSIKSALSAALCLRDFPSTLFEKDNKPYVQLTGYNPKLDYLIMKPIYLSRNKKQNFLIEPSINSCRISFSVKKSDEIQRLIAGKFSNMLASRAEMFEIVRRKPMEGYDVTFLITSDILEKYNKDFIIKAILDLVLIQKDLVNIKLNINTQARIAATFYMEQLANPVDEQLF